MIVELIAEWKANKGKHFLCLYKDQCGYIYKGEECGGVLPKLDNDELAVQYMEQNAVKVLQSDFLSVHRTK
jgi:hypothetical protein